MTSPSAVVIGGGPAGCSSTIALLRFGYEVSLLEQRAHWQGRVCGAFLNAEAVDHLRWLGLEEAVRAESAEVVRARVFLPNATMLEIPLQPGLALPRESLELILQGAVVREGGRFETGRHVSSEGSLSADLIVRADGRFASAAPAKNSDGWYGWNASFRGIAAAPGDLSLHFHEGGYVGVVTFPDGTSNLCGLTFRASEEARGGADIFREVGELLPSLHALLRGAERTSSWRGVGPLPFSWRMPCTRGLWTGDAAAVGDPYMGEGIARALGAGPLIAESLRELPGDASPREIEDRVRVRWARRYRTRLLFGGLTRMLLRRPMLLCAAVHFMKSHLRLFHECHVPAPCTRANA